MTRYSDHNEPKSTTTPTRAVRRHLALLAGLLLSLPAMTSAATIPPIDDRGMPVIDGKPLVELDGPVGHVRIDHTAGAFGYLVLTAQDAAHRTYAVRSIGFDGVRGVEVGSVVADSTRGTRSFTATRTPGQHIPFTGMVPCPGAVILTRGTLVVRIDASGVASPQVLADGWEALPADPRGGDVCGTGLVVVRRPHSTSLIRAFTTLGDNFDYGLARVTDGHIRAIPVTPDHLNASDDPLGRQIDYRQLDGHDLIAFIGPRTLRAQLLDFDSGKQVVVFERTLGLASLRFEDEPGQPLALGVDAGFTRKHQADVGAWFAAQP